MGQDNGERSKIEFLKKLVSSSESTTVAKSISENRGEGIALIFILSTAYSGKKE